MYGIIKDVISAKGYKLSDIIYKIEKRCVEGSITEKEKDELMEYARLNADFQNEFDITKLLSKIAELETRVKVLEENKSDTSTELYQPFVVGRWYYNGDTCSENGGNYICIAPEGQVCTWSPSQYPAYWQLVVETE